jgi:hypothetical protein
VAEQQLVAEAQLVAEQQLVAVECAGSEVCWQWAGAGTHWVTAQSAVYSSPAADHRTCAMWRVASGVWAVVWAVLEWTDTGARARWPQQCVIHSISTYYHAN